jgi:hypothetical protein
MEDKYKEYSTPGKNSPFIVKLIMGMSAGGIGAFIGTPAEVALIRMTSDGRFVIFIHETSALASIEHFFLLYRTDCPSRSAEDIRTPSTPSTELLVRKDSSLCGEDGSLLLLVP